MNPDYVQNLRYKLQKRFRRLNAAGWEIFHYALKQLWDFLYAQPVLVGIMEDIERRCTSYEADAEKIFAEKRGLLPETELESVGIGYWLIKRCVESEEDNIEIAIGHSYPSSGTKHDDAIELFRCYFVEPLYEYVDEQLDDERAMLGLLCRYKQKCEWFHRDHLYSCWKADTSRGEKTLAWHLYEYLHDQGIDFHIEPLSASGEVDLISAQESPEPLLADAKIYNPDKGRGKDYLAAAVQQIYTYAVDYNQSFGYLVVYKTCPDDLRLALTNQAAATPFLIYNNKTIFLIVVDIFPHEKPASKRGPLKPVEITEEDLVRVAEA